MKPHEILTKFLLKKQEHNNHFSLRYLAKQLKISPSYISFIFNGKKPIPPSRISSICSKLEMDPLSISMLLKSIAVSKISKNSSYLQSNLFYFENEIKPYEADLTRFNNTHYVSDKDVQLWSKWYFIALLDLTTCQNFKSDIGWIAKKLNLKKIEVTEAISFLLQKGYLVEKNGQLKKKNKHLRYSIKQSNSIIRSFHSQFMKKAIELMNNNQSEIDMAKRLINGTTLAVNPDKIHEAKKKLEIAINEITKILTDGNCTEVYQIGIQLFPLTILQD